jgi:DNA-binding transcriptional ArsR family regulator
MVIEIAERIGRNPDITSRHLAVLRKTGLVVTNRAGLYSIPKQYLPTPGQRVVDFGHCLLRLDTARLSAS